MKVMGGDVAAAQKVAQYLYGKYSQEGYNVHASCGVNGWTLQIRSDGSGIGGACKGLAGLDKDVVVRIRPDGQTVTVEARGDYRGKLGRMGFGTFVAFGFVAVTAAVGSVAQADLACAIENDAEEFLRNCHGRRLSQAHLAQALTA